MNGNTHTIRISLTRTEVVALRDHIALALATTPSLTASAALIEVYRHLDGALIASS